MDNEDVWLRRRCSRAEVVHEVRHELLYETNESWDARVKADELKEDLMKCQIKGSLEEEAIDLKRKGRLAYSLKDKIWEVSSG